MKHEQFDNLDELRIELLRADALPFETADKIACAPHLLKNIRARIEAEKVAAQTIEKPIVANAAANNFWRQLFGFKFAPKFAFAAAPFAVCAILIWQSGALSSINRTPENIATKAGGEAEKQAIGAEKQLIEATNPAAIEESKQTAAARILPAQNAVKTRRIAVKSNSAAVNKVVKQAVVARVEQIKQKPNRARPREFYQLAFAGELDANETKQIVRVKLSASALDALGVATPGGAPPNKAVTADLLLGEDGLPRAIRFVR